MQLRAPAEDGAIVLAPTWREMVDCLRGPVDSSSDGGGGQLGGALTDLRREGRQQIVQAASQYTRQYVDVEAAHRPQQPLVLTGHQPEIPHAGVWLKNFAASELAMQCGGTAISLMIDVDLCRSNSLPVPTGDVQSPRVRRVPFAAPLRSAAWEERAIADVDVWRSFGQRAAEVVRPLIRDPLIQHWWPEAAQCGAASGSMGEGVSQARHRSEIQWGRPSLQLPQSVVCQTESFRRFACSILANLPSFHAAYNDSLAEYRARHAVRNAAQPIPNLTDADGWLEAPFWVWSSEAPTRRALLVQSDGDQLRLTDRHQLNATLPLADHGDFDLALEQLADWEARGVKIRSRALITTLFARLAISDLFIHGIGGSKYDEVTDEICRRYFSVELSPYATLSGTLRLPIPHERASEQDLARYRRRLRELEYHPESSLDRADLTPQQATAAQEALHSKLQWIRTAKTPGNASQRHRAIAAANAALGELLAGHRAQLERDLQIAQKRTRASAILDSREYAFCLFPLEYLREFLLDFSSRLP